MVNWSIPLPSTQTVHSGVVESQYATPSRRLDSYVSEQNTEVDLGSSTWPIALPQYHARAHGTASCHAVEARLLQATALALRRTNSMRMAPCTYLCLPTGTRSSFETQPGMPHS